MVLSAQVALMIKDRRVTSSDRMTGYAQQSLHAVMLKYAQIKNTTLRK
jgi:hypothetical protein